MRRRARTERRMTGVRTSTVRGVNGTIDRSLSLADPSWTYAKAPSNQLPPVRWTDVAERRRNGESLEALGTEFGRTISTMMHGLNDRGWDSDGQPLHPEKPKPVSLLPEPPNFSDSAACSTVDPALFYPEYGNRHEWGFTAAAKRICAECDVRVQCLKYALDNNETWGVWGGTTPTERKRLKRLMDEKRAS